jgi:thioredoxin reductase (NADPH)
VGDGELLSGLKVKDTVSGAERDLDVNGLFYAIGMVVSGYPFSLCPECLPGHDPATSLVRSQLETDADGYILTVPGTTQTSVKGVFAAGDVQDKRFVLSLPSTSHTSNNS